MIYKPLNDLITKGHSLPYGYDTLGWKVVQADMTSYNGFKWPAPGTDIATPIAVPGAVCPSRDTGGLMIARNFEGAKSGGHGNRVFLVLAYNQRDILGQDDSKTRVAKVRVVAIVDPEKVFRYAAGYDLANAPFHRMNLTDSNFTNSNLLNADFRGSNISRARFDGAAMRFCAFNNAQLHEASFSGTNVGDSDFTQATVRYTSFQKANVSGTIFNGADLYGSVFTEADASNAFFNRANLTGSSWASAVIDGARFTNSVTDGVNFSRVKSGRNVIGATVEIKDGIPVAAKVAEEKAKAEEAKKLSDWSTFYPKYETYQKYRVEFF